MAGNWGFTVVSESTTVDFLWMILFERFKVSDIGLIGRVFMNCEFVGIRKVLMACFKVLSQHSPGVTEKNHDKPHSGKPAARFDSPEYEADMLPHGYHTW